MNRGPVELISRSLIQSIDSNYENISRNAYLICGIYCIHKGLRVALQSSNPIPLPSALSNWRRIFAKMRMMLSLFIASVHGFMHETIDFFYYNNLSIYQVLCALIYRRRSLYSFLLYTMYKKNNALLSGQAYDEGAGQTYGWRIS